MTIFLKSSYCKIGKKCGAQSVGLSLESNRDNPSIQKSEARVCKNRWKQPCVFSVESQRQRVMLIAWEKVENGKSSFFENERTHCLGSSIKTLGDSEGPADIWTYKHMLSVIWNVNLFSWVHEVEQGVCTFWCLTLALFKTEISYASFISKNGLTWGKLLSFPCLTCVLREPVLQGSCEN